MSSCEDFEKEKEEFMSYLDQYGVMDKLTDTLIMLYNETESPLDPIDFVRKNMCLDNADVKGIAEMKSKLVDAKAELNRLLNVRNEFKNHLSRLEGKGCSSDEDCGGVETDDDFGMDQLTATATDPKPESR
ncbi:Hypothetical protein CINCED_3A023322 [Cinara cedri]|uniref:Uncharacterized protein n=1 Tax=Cinara cedri TaxID=506608 RepID=A0A5E4M518_9HEMI|nr:Hypothetical protein CINCED_3A023322 [Cinara cedri]